MLVSVRICEYGSEVFSSLAPRHLCHECKIKPNCRLVKIINEMEKGLEGHRGIITCCDLLPTIRKGEILKI